MPEYKAIKFILRRHSPRPDGSMSPFPDIYDAFVNNPAAFANMRPHDYISKAGVGFQYDKVNNLGKGDDTGAAVCLVPAAAADAILALGHPDISQITEAELEIFWDEKSHVYDQDESEDVEVLRAIKAKRDLGMRRTAQDIAALDPDDETPGIRKNTYKTWQRFKSKRNIIIDEA